MIFPDVIPAAQAPVAKALGGTDHLNNTIDLQHSHLGNPSRTVEVQSETRYRLPEQCAHQGVCHRKNKQFHWEKSTPSSIKLLNNNNTLEANHARRRGGYFAACTSAVGVTA
jgi:hypothetical protein